MSNSNNSTSYGCGCAWSIIACVISYALNHSVGWAIFHFFCSWFYILYVVLFRTKEIWPALVKFFT